MKTFQYIITDPVGVHARPAGELVKLAKEFEAGIKLKKGDREADGKKLLAVMGLGIKKGEEVTVTAEGPDEERAAQAVEEFMRENL